MKYNGFDIRHDGSVDLEVKDGYRTHNVHIPFATLQMLAHNSIGIREISQRGLAPQDRDPESTAPKSDDDFDRRVAASIARLRLFTNSDGYVRARVRRS